MSNKLESLFKSVDTLKGIFQFLFFTVWGWVVLAIFFLIVVILNSKNEKGMFSFSKFLGILTDRLFFFFTNISQLFLSILIVFTLLSLKPVINEISETLSIYRDVKNLTALMKNLKSERKILEVQAIPEEDGNINLKLKYFAYSPVKDIDVLTGEAEYKIYGKKVYIDSLVVNFNYSLIEQGKAVNLALPYRAFSDSVSFDEGVSILSKENDIPLSLKLDDNSIFLLEKKEFDSVIKNVMKALSDKKLALKMGIRTFYSEAVVITPSRNKTYSIYSTGVGGLTLGR
ncbi:MAG: hypothetical protein ACP5QT_00430 [Brevinematia bacterium]